MKASNISGVPRFNSDSSQSVAQLHWSLWGQYYTATFNILGPTTSQKCFVRSVTWAEWEETTGQLSGTIWCYIHVIRASNIVPTRQYVGDFPVRYLTTGSNADVTATLSHPKLLLVLKTVLININLFQYECYQNIKSRFTFILKIYLKVASVHSAQYCCKRYDWSLCQMQQYYSFNILPDLFCVSVRQNRRFHVDHWENEKQNQDKLQCLIVLNNLINHVDTFI